MTSYLKKILVAGAFAAFATTLSVSAQNVVVSGALTGNGTYPTVESAFTAINAGAQTGSTILVSIVGNTTETASAILNSGAWASLTISPAGGSARLITGNLAASLIDFNGADNVLVDGLNTGGNSLSIQNSNTGAASTLNFQNDADMISVANVTIVGAGTSTTSGTVFIGTSSNTGNDSITFTSCSITCLPGAEHTNAVYAFGTAGRDNEYITFSSCNIFDYFNAAQPTAGIMCFANNGIWTVQNCRFFQTLARTYTTGNTHRAIFIGAGAGHNIISNTIGYSSAAATGTYTMGGTIATRFIGIDLSAGTSATSQIQGNTVTAIQLNTSSGASTTYGILCGISVTAGNVNIGTTAGNVIGGTSGVNLLSAVSTTSGGLIVGIHTSSTGAISIQNNSIGGLSSSGVTAAVSGSCFGINNTAAASSYAVSGNTIGNSTANNMRGGTSGLTTASSSVAGINLPTHPSGAVNITGNTIQNFSSFGSGTASFCRGIMMQLSSSPTAVYTITSNVITNLTCSGALAGLTSGNVCVNGIHYFCGGNGTIASNSISNLSCTNTGTGNYIVAGITLASASAVAGDNNITGNSISNLQNAGTGTTATSPPVVTGIAVRSGSGNSYNIQNNMIALGSGMTTNTCIVGIWANHGSTPNPNSVNIRFNTVNLEGVVTAGALPTFCYNRGTLAAANAVPTDIRNNIFTNNRSGGTGLHYAISNGHGATANAGGWSANNNVLNAQAANVGYWSAALTFANWQTTSANDAASYSGITVTYVNAASNLHLNMGVTPTVIESGAQVIAAVSTDIDGDVRPGPVASVNGGALMPDIGADEIDAVPLDIIAPTITYTPLTDACVIPDRTVTATITDLFGVPTAGILQPRIYFRKNAGPWFSGQGTLMTGTATNGTWDFVITAATMGGVNGGDVIDYFVIAQDIATTPNISSTPSAGMSATDVNTVSSYPTSPNSVTVDNLSVGASPVNSNVCTGDNLTLSGSGALSYAWTGPQAITDNVAFTATVSGTYTVTGTGANGCMDTATAMVVVNALPTVTATPSSATVCSGDSVTFSGSGAASYTWSGPQAITDGVPFSATTNGTYTVTGTDVNGCMDSATAAIVVNPLPVVTASPTSTTVCSGDSVTLNGNGATSYAWTGPEPVTDGIPFSATISGTYTVTGTDANGCMDTDTAMVMVNALPVVVYSEPVDTACQTTTPVFALSGATPSGGTWSGPGVAAGMFDAMNANIGSNLIVYTYTDSITGCMNSATDSIYVDLCLSVAQFTNNANISVYPNPNNGFFTIAISNSAQSVAIEVVSADGKVVYADKQNNTGAAYTKEIDLSSLSNGAYFMKVTQDNSTDVVKVLITK